MNDSSMFGSDGFQSKIAAFRADDDWRRLWSLLQDGYWHATSRSAWSQIREAGAIRPNLEKRYGLTWPQSERNFGYVRGATCLFDFATATEEECISQWSNICHMLSHHRGGTILLRLNRAVLDDKIIPNSAYWDRKNRACLVPTATGIAYAEAWYPSDISIAAIEKAYIVSDANALNECRLIDVALDEPR